MMWKKDYPRLPTGYGFHLPSNYIKYMKTLLYKEDFTIRRSMNLMRTNVNLFIRWVYEVNVHIWKPKDWRST